MAYSGHHADAEGAPSPPPPPQRSRWRSRCFSEQNLAAQVPHALPSSAPHVPHSGAASTPVHLASSGSSAGQ